MAKALSDYTAAVQPQGSIPIILLLVLVKAMVLAMYKQYVDAEDWTASINTEQTPSSWSRTTVGNLRLLYKERRKSLKSVQALAYAQQETDKTSSPAVAQPQTETPWLPAGLPWLPREASTTGHELEEGPKSPDTPPPLSPPESPVDLPGTSRVSCRERRRLRDPTDAKSRSPRVSVGGSPEMSRGQPKPGMRSS
ncbi:uncharacterized protein LOC121046168 [Ixodes scapularis]|uniref:uncharacterized protein LOC121046168 n=1 Tax=Ixodes scapularis TaxID=6945 RepID=UPI001161C0D7|nr:uncharacterized protein LOC121046168 [Ixodes scapularis]